MVVLKELCFAPKPALLGSKGMTNLRQRGAAKGQQTPGLWDLDLILSLALFGAGFYNFSQPGEDPLVFLNGEGSQGSTGEDGGDNCVTAFATGMWHSASLPCSNLTEF